jgi:hypothetical protein
MRPTAGRRRLLRRHPAGRRPDQRHRPRLPYNQLDYSGNRGFGDYQDDLHYATSNGATVTYTFIGTKITAFAEENTASRSPTADPPLELMPA